MLAGCALTTPAQVQTSPPPGGGRTAELAQPARTAQPLDKAVADLTDALLARAEMPASGGRALVIDPLIDRTTEMQTATTRSIGAMMAERVRSGHPRFEMHPFNGQSLARKPLIVLGSINGVVEAGSTRPATGQPPVYRIWAVLADLQTNRVLGREMVWVQAGQVNATPTAFFRDSPAWASDPVAAAYIRTCSSTAGTPIDPVYLQALEAQALLADAVVAYEARQYQEALDSYTRALSLPGGEQLRTLNGLYLTSRALHRRDEAEQAFGQIIDYGLRQERLAVKLLFRPGSTAFWPDPAVSGPYLMWLRQIARRADERSTCLLIAGHTSITGGAVQNDRLSLARAERVRSRLTAERPGLRERTKAEGFGSRQPIVGTGTDDAADALDRRVEFKPLTCRLLNADFNEAPSSGT